MTTVSVNIGQHLIGKSPVFCIFKIVSVMLRRKSSDSHIFLRVERKGVASNLGSDTRHRDAFVVLGTPMHDETGVLLNSDPVMD